MGVAGYQKIQLHIIKGQEADDLRRIQNRWNQLGFGGTSDIADISVSAEAAGTSTLWARADHVHKLNTTDINLGDLGDVTITAKDAGDYIRYSGSAWVDVTISQIITDLSLDDIIGGSGIAVTAGAATIIGGNATVDVGALTADHDWGAYQIRALQFYADGAADAGGVFFGDTTQIWQSAANMLYTPDSFTVAGVIKMGNNSRIIGTGSGNANLAFLSFYDSNGTTRRGFVGDWASGDTDIFVGSDTGDVGLYVQGTTRLQATTTGVHITGILTGATSITTSGTVQAEHFYSTDDVQVDGQIFVNLATSMLAHVNITGDAASIDDREYGLWMRGKVAAYIVQLNIHGSKLEIGGGASLDTTPSFTVDYLTGQIAAPITGSGAGILIGGDANLYRSAANVLKTDDRFEAIGPGTDVGGFAGALEVVGYFKQNVAGRHSALSIDALAGRDATYYLSSDGEAMWDIRFDASSSDAFEIRYQGRVNANTTMVRVPTGGGLSLGTNSLLFGTFGSEDVELKRLSPNVLHTPDAMRIGGKFQGVYDAGANASFFEGAGVGENPILNIYGDDGGVKRYGRFQVNTAGTFSIDAEEAFALASGTGLMLLNFAAEQNIEMFSGATSGETRELKIWGYRATDALRTLEIGVGVDAADTVSFDGLGNYLFDGKLHSTALESGGASDYTEIESDGDVNFVGGGGLQFGEIYFHGAGFDTALAAQDTDYQVLGFDTDGEANGNITPDHTNDHITVGVAGRYKVCVSISARSAAANAYEFHVGKNDNAVTFDNTAIHRTTSTANRLGSKSCQAIIDCAAADTLEVWVRRVDGGGVTKTITIESITFNVVQIGGT